MNNASILRSHLQRVDPFGRREAALALILEPCLWQGDKDDEFCHYYIFTLLICLAVDELPGLAVNTVGSNVWN